MSTVTIPDRSLSGRGKPYPDLVIRASAGTGKTFQLSNRFLGQLLSGADPDHILATTFTRKAAGEILERVLLRLAHAALDSTACRDLAGHVKIPNLSRSACLNALTTLTHHLHRMRVCTLDSFFAQLAMSFCLDLGFPPGWRVADELQEKQLRERAIDVLLRDSNTESTVRLMHLLTKGLADRSVRDLIDDAVRSLYRVFLQTHRQAWEKLPAEKPLTGETLAQLARELEDLELPAHKTLESQRRKDLELIRNEDWERLVESGYAAKVLEGAETYYSKPIPDDVRDVYHRLLRHVRAVLVTRLNHQSMATRELLERFDVVYRQLMQETRTLRFDDITHGLSDLSELSAADSSHTLDYRLDAGVDHLLLDEFQDTSLEQWLILRPFARQVAGANPDRSFFCVGDTKQAIYGWRGGLADIFDAIEDELPGVASAALTESFRSAPVVIEAVNRIFKNLPQHGRLDRAQHAVEAWCAGFLEHTAHRKQLRGYVSLTVAPSFTEYLDADAADDDDDELENASDAKHARKGKKRKSQAGESELQLNATVRFAAERVAEIVRQAPDRTVGVLVRRNRVVGKLMYELRKLGVPASEEGGNPLTDAVPVQLLLSLMHFIDHPGDSIARFQLANSPLGPPLDVPERDDVQGAAQAAQELRNQLMREGYGTCLERWAAILRPHCTPRDLSRLARLVDLAWQYQSQATLRADDFVAHVEHQRVSEPTMDRVRVMTVHQSKGLQFDIVVLPDLEIAINGQPDSYVIGRPDRTARPDFVSMYCNQSLQKLLPEDVCEAYTQASDQEVYESLCVLYVALTRAVSALHLIVAPEESNRASRSHAGLLCQALAAGKARAPRETLFELGDRNWYEGPKAVTAEPAREEPETVQIRMAAMPEQRARGLARRAPSQHEGARRIKSASILRLDNAAALERGTLIHAWCEAIEWLDQGRPTESVLRRIADEIGAHGLDVDAALLEFARMLDQTAVQRMLHRASYADPRQMPWSDPVCDQIASEPCRLRVENERRFAVRAGNAVVAGIIDRLVLVYHGQKLVAADIIDFKTDRVGGETSEQIAQQIADKIESYRGQLEAYRPAVAQLYDLPLERIAARIVLLGPGVVARVQDANTTTPQTGS